MDCEQASELMSLRLDGELSPAEVGRLGVHLEGCAACRKTWAAMQRVSLLFVEAPLMSPPEDFTSRVMSRLAQRQARKAPVWGALVLLLGAGALTLLAVAQLLGVAGILLETLRHAGLMPRLLEVLPGFFVGRALVQATWLFLRAFLSLVSPELVILYVGVAMMLSTVWLLVLRAVTPAVRTARAG